MSFVAMVGIETCKLYMILLKYSSDTCNCFFKISAHKCFFISPLPREIFVRLIFPFSSNFL